MIDTLHQVAAKVPREKDIFLYLNHTERNHGRRVLVADKFWDQPYCFNRNRPRRYNYDQFWDETSRSKFVLSPLGLEVDCTRTWECFVLGAIPIVEHSYLDPLYKGLPILLINDWDEINEEFLNRKYAEIQSQPHTLEKAYIDYWANFIREKQAVIRSGNLSSTALEANNFTSEDLVIIRNILGLHNKLHTSLIYRGNGTFLRPFQLACAFKRLPKITVYDFWSFAGAPYLKQFCKDKSLLESRKIEILDPHLKELTSPGKTHFLDLTHFRHSLFTSPHGPLGLDDFCHSLELDISSIFTRLAPGDLLMGNMSQDSYVEEVLSRLKQRQGMNIQTQGNFFYCKKSK